MTVIYETEQQTMMNGPAQFEMKVWIINDETEQAGQVTIGLGSFKYPTPRSISARIAKFEAEECVGSIKGFRLMTKHEAFNAAATEFYKEPVRLVAAEAWDPIESDNENDEKEISMSR